MSANGSAAGQLLAAQILRQVLRHGRSLTACVRDLDARSGNAAEHALARELCYGTLRWLPRLELIIEQLVQKAIKQKDLEVKILLLLGLYQILHTSIPAHAAVDLTVSSCDPLGKSWAKSLVNGVLRTFLRRRSSIEADLANNGIYLWAHPQWMLDRFKRHWPQDWKDVCSANNQRPPMSLRVNRRMISPGDYRDRLRAAGLECECRPGPPESLTLVKPVNVSQLPGFSRGLVSVQDAAAQLAAHLLDLAPGQRVLDVCAAPGGKLAHILELQPALSELLAVDIDEKRLTLVRDNLMRLKLSARVCHGDAREPDAWWDGSVFDRILVDAPCSATGVIRRQPDVKVHRRPSDIDNYVETQLAILSAVWPLLAPGGKLLYSTCSILPSENQELLERFIEGRAQAHTGALSCEFARKAGSGIQCLPGRYGMDGFFYGLLAKKSAGEESSGRRGG